MMEARYAWAAERARGKRVLELGCGSGQGLGLLQESAAAVVGGDPMHKLLTGAKNHYGDRVVLVALDAHRLPFRADSFDVIVMFEMIYYLQDPAAVLHECRRVLSADAVILIATANPERPDFNPSPYSHRYFSAAELVKLFAEAGFAGELLAGFPAADPGFKSKVLALARRVAVRLHLIPKTMAGKAWLKRLVYGELQTVTEVSGDGTPPRLEPWK
ncbi:MAG TPA: class I SAM-dependent methyltransferase [Actinomycetota bacterium]|nr:class I SAM-dependent methyltransferase [Actinomycetota bacterium]